MPGLIAEIQTLYEINIEPGFENHCLLTVFKIQGNGTRIILFRLLIPTVNLENGILRYRATSIE